MFLRLISIPKNNSFFLFGPRGSGKSTHLVQHLITPNSLYINLLEDAPEARYQKNPDMLVSDVLAKKDSIDWVIIDEVQKIPKLLDLVHKLIEENKINFALTGSSARKLKRAGANLLAGRAFWLNLFPLTCQELGDAFLLQDILSWGSLPKIFSYLNNEDKKHFLNSYVKTYIREEIIIEQIIRNIQGFRDFLEVAAQMNGRNLNFSKISRETGLDAKTIREYFQILEDTLIGFWVPAFHQSVRKAQKFQPKFYFFDIGVRRAIEGTLDSPSVPGTFQYGHDFEHFIMTEVFRLNSYSQKNYKISHYQTATGGEIDLILSKGMKKIVIEIKSTSSIDPMEVKAFNRLALAFKNAPRYFVSQDPITTNIEGTHCLHFREFFNSLF